MFHRVLASMAVAGILASATLIPASASPARSSVNLTGAGSTFDLPYFTKAFDVYQHHHPVSVNYQAIGSGAGIQLFTQKTVDFGATDVPMNPTTELQAAIHAGGPVEQIPIDLGGVAVSYNIPGVKSGLHLTGDVLARIYLGTITRWNDVNIRRLNRKIHLPDLQIVVAHRSDASGTSYIFTDYLSEISDQWRGIAGTGKLPNWPVGVGGKGNPGVAAIVQQTPGAIGYVELAYVLQNHMKEAALQNRAHRWQFPTLKSVSSAAAQFPHVSAQRFSIVNAKGKNSYPISGYSWVLVFRDQADKTKGRALVNLLRWMVLGGQKYAKGLDYAPLPRNVQKIGVHDLRQIK